MGDQMPDLFQRMNLEGFLQKLGGQIRYGSHLLQVNRNALATAALQCLSYHAALAEASGADEHKMIGALNELLDIDDFLDQVSELFLFDYCSELKRVFSITHNFVTNFFVIQI
ncbi:MAG: hypothetical protein KBT00_04735 [Bacteroidales bacterium]|nr:hypothetical protein [Candidatus Cacconaster merdequi]